MIDYREILKRRKSRVLFLTADDFLAACVDYFEWAKDTPLLEEEMAQFKGAWVRGDKEKMRPFTKKGLCIHLGIPESRIAAYKAKDDEWAEAVEFIEQIIYNQKFEGAAAGLLNASIISRDLGLAEKSEVTGPGGGPLQRISTDMTPKEAADAYAATLDGSA